jgi:hypothetical protein
MSRFSIAIANHNNLAYVRAAILEILDTGHVLPVMASPAGLIGLDVCKRQETRRTADPGAEPAIPGTRHRWQGIKPESDTIHG